MQTATANRLDFSDVRSVEDLSAYISEPLLAVATAEDKTMLVKIQTCTEEQISEWLFSDKETATQMILFKLMNKARKQRERKNKVVEIRKDNVFC